MPKIIDNVKDEILNAAITIIKDQKMPLSIRTVAKECNVSIGTVYNYFQSKEELTDSAISLFINTRIQEIRKEVEKVHTNKEKCFIIYKSLEACGKNFCSNFEKHLNSVMLLPKEDINSIKERMQLTMAALLKLTRQELKIENDVVAKTITMLLFGFHMENNNFEEIWEVIEKLI